jgi:hypothetical protein
MPDQIERTLRRLGGQLSGRVSMPARTATLPRPQSGRSRWAACRVLSFTAGRPKTPSWPFERHAIPVFPCRRAAAGTIGPAARCAPASWIDLSGMNGVIVDADHRSALIAGGARLGRCARDRFARPRGGGRFSGWERSLGVAWRQRLTGPR